MKIAIDLRSLQSGSVSGVENYALNLTQALLKADHKNEYILFYNSWRSRPLPGDFHYVNARIVTTRIPNKILNVLFKFRLLTIERLIGDVDVLLMPNVNQIHLRPQTKLAVTVHDLSFVVTPEFYDFKRRLWHRFINFKRIFRRANILFAVSEYTKQDLVRLFQIDKEKICVAYPGLDHHIFHANIPVATQRIVRNTYNLPGRFILFLNTLEPRKNLVSLIKAFDLLTEPVALVIAGKHGWKTRAIMRHIQKSKKRNSIAMLGYVSEHDKPALIALSEVLAYPSLYEGFGFQPLEAAAVGVPVLSSQVTSTPEVIGDAALLINPYNVEDIAHGLEQLLNNHALRAMLVTKGITRAREFRWEKTGEKILAAFNTL